MVCQKCKIGGSLMNFDELYDPQSESGIIASLIYNPEFFFHSDALKSNYFYNSDNGFLYYALGELAKKGVDKIDSYNILMMLNGRKFTKDISKTITKESLDELISISKHIARDSVEEYLLLVENVIEMAFRRAIYKELEACKLLCLSNKEQNLQEVIYNKVEKVISEFSGIDKIPKLGDVVDELWAEIEERHANGGMCGLPSKIPEINEYFTYENGELILVCGVRKEGKSIWGLNEAIHKLGMGKAILHIDTEMSSRQNLERMISHITEIPVRNIKNGNYSKEDGKRIQEAIGWIKKQKYTHIYMPTPDLNKVYSIMKRMKYNNELDFVVYDYIKSQGLISASEVYNTLGDITNFLKNRCAGELGIPILALAQLNRSLEIADSFKIEQYASVVALLKRKDLKEIQRDGDDCGNYKFFIKLNRLGAQMSEIESEYIDLEFKGNIVSFKQAKRQHEEITPY